MVGIVNDFSLSRLGPDTPNKEDMIAKGHAFQKGKQFSRKLKRRLTQRTVAEAKALKKQSKEAIHILVYATELVSSYSNILNFLFNCYIINSKIEF